MKTVLMGIGFIMGISLASSCVFGETSQKRLNEYSGEELKRALDEVMSRLTSAGYQPIPGTLKYEFDASRVRISPESKPVNPESGEDKSDELSNDAALGNDSDHPPFNSFSPFLHSLISQNKDKHNAGNDDKQDGISKLSEKKKAMIFCVMQEMQNKKVSLAPESQDPIVQKCMQILRYAKEGKLVQSEMDTCVAIVTGSYGHIEIEFKGSGGRLDRIEIEGNRELKLVRNDGADDAWFESLSLMVYAYDKKHAQGSVPSDSSKPSSSGSETGEPIDFKSLEGSKPSSNAGDEADSSDSEENKDLDAWISKLSEKKKAFIRCVRHMMWQSAIKDEVPEDAEKLKDAALSDTEKQTSPIKECLQILENKAEQEVLRADDSYVILRGFVVVKVNTDFSLEIEFKIENVEIGVTPKGEIDKIYCSKEDDLSTDTWFDYADSWR